MYSCAAPTLLPLPSPSQEWSLAGWRRGPPDESRRGSVLCHAALSLTLPCVALLPLQDPKRRMELINVEALKKFTPDDSAEALPLLRLQAFPFAQQAQRGNRRQRRTGRHHHPRTEQNVIELGPSTSAALRAATGQRRLMVPDAI